MKSKLSLFSIAIFILIYQSCTSSKKTVAPENTQLAAVSYDKDIAPIMIAHCTPCHFPEGEKDQFNTYERVLSRIDDILDRTQRAQDAEGFMPHKLKKPALNEEELAVMFKWLEAGMPEK